MHLTYKEALKAKETDFFKEYCIRAARVTEWLGEENEIDNEELLEDLFTGIVGTMIYEREEYGEIGQRILERLLKKLKWFNNWLSSFTLVLNTNGSFLFVIFLPSDWRCNDGN